MGQQISEETWAEFRGALGLPASASKRDVVNAAAKLMEQPAAKPAVVDRPIRPGEDPIDWCVATGRISAKSAALAKGATPSPSVSAGAGASRSRPQPTAYSRNPLVEAAGAMTQSIAAAAGTAEPEVFSTGPTPPFTASGMDPVKLLEVPWKARHALAAASAAEAEAMYAELTGPEGALIAETDRRYYAHPGNGDYEARVASWIAAGQRRHAATAWANDARQQAAQVAASGPAKDPSEMTEDEQYELLFGDADRHRAQVAASRGRVLGAHLQNEGKC